MNGLQGLTATAQSHYFANSLTVYDCFNTHVEDISIGKSLLELELKSS